jgi:hypothetical protein
MLLLALLLLVIAIVGGVALHPLLFVLAIIALFMLFSGWRGRAAY